MWRYTLRKSIHELAEIEIIAIISILARALQLFNRLYLTIYVTKELKNLNREIIKKSLLLLLFFIFHSSNFFFNSNKSEHFRFIFYFFFASSSIILNIYFFVYFFSSRARSLKGNKV